MPRKAKGPYLAAKIGTEVLKKVKLVAAFESKDIAEILTEIVDPVIEKRLAYHLKVMNDKRQ